MYVCAIIYLVCIIAFPPLVTVSWQYLVDQNYFNPYDPDDITIMSWKNMAWRADDANILSWENLAVGWVGMNLSSWAFWLKVGMMGKTRYKFTKLLGANWLIWHLHYFHWLTSVECTIWEPWLKSADSREDTITILRILFLAAMTGIAGCIIEIWILPKNFTVDNINYLYYSCTKLWTT